MEFRRVLFRSLPAALAILGRNIDRPKWLARPLARFHAPTGWERWARWLGHRPWRAVAVGGAAIALLTFPLSQIRLGLPATNWFPPESESGMGLEALREMGASGVIQPVRVVVQLPEGESALSARRLPGRSEEHTSELQSRLHLVCRLLLE